MTEPASQEPPAHPSLGETTRVFARIGLLSFGGPAGQIGLMHRELVERRRWISDARFLHALNFCMLLPGPEAQQLATYIGWLLHGRRGGLIAGILFVLPGFVVITALATAYLLWHGTGILDGPFLGLKAAVLVIVVEALLRVARRALKTRMAWLLAGAAFLAIYAVHVPFPLIVLAAGLVGWVAARLSNGGAGAPVTEAPDETVIGRLRPAPRRPAAATARLVAVAVAVWAAPAAVLAFILGPDTIFVPIALFFSKMAVVTFGGAYAVLAYVAQQAVETYGWLRPGEMVDALALAETTPGPLVLVLSFVGTIAAFRSPGPLDPVVAGLIGSAVTTWVTFVPCFLWIFAFAPHVERLRSNPRIAGALSAITAAVVGIILNLAIWFALHVLFRQVGPVPIGPLAPTVPDPGSFDPAAFAIAVLAGVLLLHRKASMVATLAISAAAGTLVHFAGLSV